MIWNAMNTLYTLYVSYIKPPQLEQIVAQKTPVKHFGIISLPDTLFDFIGSKLSLGYLLSMKSICKELNRALETQCSFRLEKQYNDVISHFPLHVIGSVPFCIWLDLEWVDFKPEWLGSTGYIDNVRPSDICGHPFKCCKDSYGRLAILMRRKTDVAVLFQRYIDSSTTWAFASATLPIGGCRLTDSMVAKLTLWLAHDYADFRG